MDYSSIEQRNALNLCELLYEYITGNTVCEEEKDLPNLNKGVHVGNNIKRPMKITLKDSVDGGELYLLNGSMESQAELETRITTILKEKDPMPAIGAFRSIMKKVRRL